RGLAISPTHFGFSYDGGLTFARPPSDLGGGQTGQAFGIRARGKALYGLGRVDAAYRYRSSNFSDGAHLDLGSERRFTFMAEQPVKSFRVGALVDDRQVSGGAPLDLSELTLRDARTFGGYVGYHLEKFDARVEARSVSLQVERASAIQSGSRIGVGAQVRYQVTNAVALVGSHHQSLSRSGEGPGAFDDTLSLVGADVAVSSDAEVGVRGGWGPALGPVGFFTGQYRDGRDVHYGSYSVDVDGPSISERRMVTGVRSEVYEGGSVFVEDVAAHDETSIRLARAAGVSAEPIDGLNVYARYERGLRQPWQLPESFAQDAGGVGLSFVRERIKLYGRGELRAERDSVYGTVTTLQRVLSGAAEVKLLESVRYSGRVNFADTYQGAARRARLLEATTGLSWRGELGVLVLQYSTERELQPPEKSDAGERGFHAFSLLPAVHIGSRFTLSSGFHVGQAFEGGNSSIVLSGSLRPSVNVVGGLELAAEVAARTAAPIGAQSRELHALRGEVGYRFNEQMLLAAGYTVFGYQGIGISNLASDSRDRAYIRAELGY
ncbi:MAG: flagellar motor protein, partial [Myxococcaceae bacterium]